MALDNFEQELEEYCDEDQFKRDGNTLKLRTGTFRNNVLMEHLVEAIHPHGLEVTYDGDVKIQPGGISGGGDIDNLVQSTDGLISREEYEERFVDDERHKTGGNDVYIMVDEMSEEQSIKTLIRGVECGFYPAGYKLATDSDTKFVMLAPTLSEP